MPRKTRKLILCDNGVYHVINRGNNKQTLFRDEKDYIKFKRIVAFYKKKFQFQLFHYCLMVNHFHLLLRIGKAGTLPRMMQGISQTYAKYHRERYGNVGYLFQGRYKSMFIEKDEYLLECGRYIERNPLRAGLVSELSEYKWFSYNYYARGDSDSLITPDILYTTFGHTTPKRKQSYIKYVAEPRPYELLVDEMVKK